MKYKNGLAFPDADQYLFDRIPEQGVWQDEALELGLAACKSFRTAIDAGAHVGTWSIALSKRFENVISFEPAPDTFEALTQNVGQIDNVSINNVALSNGPGLIKMAWTKRDKKRNHTGARFITKVESDQEGHIECIDLDSLNLQEVDFIKLDLEGGEPDALQGMVYTLDRCRPIVVFEDKGFCERFGYGKDASRGILATLGAHEIAKAGINRVWGWV